MIYPLSRILSDVDPIFISQYYNSYAGRGPYLQFFHGMMIPPLTYCTNTQMIVAFTEPYSMFKFI